MSFRTRAIGVLCAACVATSGYFFSHRSSLNLAETRIELQQVASCAIKITPVDFVIVDGKRTEAEHQANLAKGVSWIKRSRHQDGAAIDVAAYVNGEVSYDPDLYLAIAGAFYICSDQLRIPIVSGGEWKVKDLMHIELDRKFYP